MKSRKKEMERLRARAASACASAFPGSVPVFGEGPCPCGLMIIGEAPGREETRLGRPFVGKAGSFFVGVFERAAGIGRDEAYITNVVKAWPRIDTRRGKTRPPGKEELRPFIPLVLEEIGLVDPSVIVAVGRTAFSALLPAEEFKPGQWSGFEGRAVLPVYHPSYLLRRQKSLSAALSELEKALSGVRGRL